MESNMDDSLTFNDSITEFDPSEGIVVGQPEIILDNSTNQNMSMEFDQMVDQPVLMETGQEEVVGQHFTLDPEGEYTLQDNQPIETVIETTPFITSTSRVGVQLTPQTYIQAPANAIKAVQGTPHFVAIRPSPTQPSQPPQMQPSPSPLRHIAIAPKPSPINAGKKFVSIKRTVQPQLATTKLVKKVSLSNVMQAAKGQPVLAQIGKQLVMIPAGGGAQQKIKLMKSDGKPIQAQFIQSKPTQKPVIAKVIVQNQPQLGQIENLNQSAVLTKLSVGSAGFSIANSGHAAAPAPRFVTVQSKTVPVSSGNSVVMASPTKQIVTKQQVLLGSPQKKPGKKFIITMNPQESPAKPVTPQKPTITQALDSPNFHTQIHKINVPGKGIQYIKLVTNKNAPIQPTNVVTKPKPVPKTIVLTDNEGHFIQMIDGKIANQSVVVTSGAANKVMKPAGPFAQPTKLVRIAPAVTNTAQQNTVAQPRTQSLLAPSEPPPLAELSRTTPDQPEFVEEPDTILPDVDLEPETKPIIKSVDEEDEAQDYIEEELTDADLQTTEVEISFERQSSIAQDESTHSAEEFGAELQDDEHPLLVMKPDTGEKKRKKRMKKEDYFLERGLSISQNTLMGAVSPPNENDLPELELRPRKPCNCTKSRCLKLYCDCFANGEFCNSCNCQSCLNNLQHEELRQKAIRGCLDRNPNAFRPKIGKSRIGGAGALPAPVRRHNKGCNCKRSGCLKNYCECYEAKIACSSICKCFGCRNVEDNLGRRIDAAMQPPGAPREPALLKQPCSFMTAEVIEAVCQCLVAAAAEPPSPPATPAAPAGDPAPPRDPVAGVIEEFARCLQDIVSAAQQGPPVLADGSRT